MLAGTDWVLIERELIEPFQDAPIFPEVGYFYIEVYDDWGSRAESLKHEEYREKFTEWLWSVADHIPEQDELFPPDGRVRFYLSAPIGDFITAEELASPAAERETEVDVEFLEELPVDNEEKERFQKEVVDIP